MVDNKVQTKLGLNFINATLFFDKLFQGYESGFEKTVQLGSQVWRGAKGGGLKKGSAVFTPELQTHVDNVWFVCFFIDSCWKIRISFQTRFLVEGICRLQNQEISVSRYLS